MDFTTVTLICVLIHVTESFNIMQKVKSKYARMNSKLDKLLDHKEGEQSSRYNSFEYPGTNETLRQIHREHWLNYYECLKEKYAEAGPRKAMYPISLMALQGTSIVLDCGLCISPAELHTIELVNWYYDNSRRGNINNETVELNEHTLVAPNDRSLQMYNLQPHQTGKYWCVLGYTIGTPYYLYVDDGSEPLRMTRPNNAPYANHALEPTIISRYALILYSDWTEWTLCSVCGQVGKKIRYGYCTISFSNNSTHTTTLKTTKTLENPLQRFDGSLFGSQNKEKGNDTEVIANTTDIRSLLQNVLLTFRNKIPCRSKYTPSEIQNIDEVRNRRSEIMVTFCKTECLKNVIFEVRDRSGRVLESSNNSAGIYSMLQGVPEPPPSVTRITLYKKHGEKVTINCPGNLNTDTPAIWQIGQKVVNPLLIAEQSQGRIYINMKNELTIKELRYVDENVYSCWQNQELAGTIQLRVTQVLVPKIDHHVLIVGAVIIVTLFLYIFYKAYRGRNRYTKH